MGAFFGYVDYTLDGRPFYVGKGSRSRVGLQKRRNAKHGGISAKYGKVRVVEFASSIERAVLDWEIETIAALQTLADLGAIGCNFTTGGETFVFTEAVRAKMRRARRARPPATLETRKKMGLAHRGRKDTPAARAARIASVREWYATHSHPQKGKPRPPEIVEGMRARMLGNQLSDETRAKISASLKGRKIPPEVLAKRGPR
jgi:hypothetical protein